MTAIKLFYSWQTDTPTKSNKFFIKKAIETAINEIENEITIEERLDITLDQDTKNVPGSPNIVNTILKKIDDCDIFLADLTFVAKVPKKHGVSNPNVLTERGYALKSQGSERMIAVINEAYGSPENLPFDLQGIRWPLRYNIKNNDTTEQRKLIEKKLSNDIKNAILCIIKNCSRSQPKINSIEKFNELILNVDNKIKIHKIIKDECDKICLIFESKDFSLEEPINNDEQIQSRAYTYAQKLKTLIDMAVVSCYWGASIFSHFWKETISRVGYIKIQAGRPYTAWINLALTPALILFYAAGMAALKANKFDTLFNLFQSHIKKADEYHQEAITKISPVHLSLNKKQLGFTAVNFSSQFLEEVLQPSFTALIPNEREYKYIFALFELLFNLVFIDERIKSGGRNIHVFCSLSFSSLKSNNGFEEFKKEIDQYKTNHPLLLAGFFNGEYENAARAFKAIEGTTIYA